MDCPCMLHGNFSLVSNTVAATKNFTFPRNNTPFKFLHQNPSIFLPHRRNLGLFSIRPVKRDSLIMNVSAVSSVGTSEEVQKEEKEERRNKNSVGDKVKLKVRLDHQVAFGEHVAILGSAKELGSWKKKVMMDWAENGWVCNLEFKSNEEPLEYKFVIEGKDKENLTWESGDNRTLNFPGKGSFYISCKWNATNEQIEILPLEEKYEKEVKKEDGGVITDAVEEVATTSAFVEQWQGKDVSFVRSKDNLDAEKQRRWDTSGLEGVALKLVEGDRGARNWWRKLEIVRELVIDKIESGKCLEALTYSAIYLKVKLLALKMEVIIGQTDMLKFQDLYFVN